MATALSAVSDGDYFAAPMPSYCSQFASRELVSQFLDGEIEPADDPRQSEFGFKSAEEYGYWAPRLCGIVCVKMVLDGQNATNSETVADLTRHGLELGGYDVETDKGWYYRALIDLAEAFGMKGSPFAGSSVEDLCAEILRGTVPVASVHPKVIRGDIKRPPEGSSGGHLVVVTGFRWRNQECAGLFLHNSSGRTVESQENVFISREHFLNAFAGRGFTLSSSQLPIDRYSKLAIKDA